MSDIRFNQWLHQSGTGGVSQVDGGHVGIGTTNPDIAVHTANTKKINVGIVTANSVYAGAYYGDGSNLTGLASDKIEEGDTKVEVVDSGDQYIAGEVNGSEKIRIDSSGRVLIGETSVAGSTQKLVIGNGGAENFEFSPAMTSNNLNGGLIEYIHRGDGNTRPDLNLYTGGASNIKLYTNGTERIRITSEGYLKIVDNGVQQTNTTLSYQYEGAFLTHYVARTTAGGDRYRRMLDIASVGANPHGSSIRLLTSPDDTNPATTVERVRIDHNGRVGINKSQPATMLSIKAERSAVPRFGIDGHYSDSSYTQSTWDDSNGLYTLLGVNHKLDANGNNATPIASLHSSSILLDGRSGRTYFYVKPNSGTTFTEAMKISKYGVVTTSAHPSFSAKGVGATFTYFANNNAWYSLGDTVLTNTSYKNDQNFATSHSFGMNRGVLSNGNSCFNADTTVFTAPVDGFYHFCISLYLRASNGGGTCHISPWINNSNTNLYNYNGSDTTTGDLSYPPATRTIDVKLSAGDTFFWAVYAVGTDKFSIYQDYSYISGYLIG